MTPSAPAPVRLVLPESSLVLLVGPSGCGKSTFARARFAATEIVSSDHFRAIVCDDEGNQAASRDAFTILHEVVACRLAWRRFTVIDATNLKAEARRPLLDLARRYHFATCAIVFDMAEEVCRLHNERRSERQVPEGVIARHVQTFQQSRAALDREGYQHVYTLRSPAEADSAVVVREPLALDRRGDHGPFDIIGDIHGCIDELRDLLTLMGYRVGERVEPPLGRMALFVGDLCDRGPDTPAVYRLVLDMVEAGHALAVIGNHDWKLLRSLLGNDVKLGHGLAETLEQLSREPPALRDRIRDFLNWGQFHYLLDDGKLVVAHAGLRHDLQGRMSARVRSFALFGETTGRTNEHSLPIRLDWASEYRGPALVVFGHTPTVEPVWSNNTVNIDTGCVFGGKLSALRYPEREIVSVPARKVYCDPGHRFGAAAPPGDDPLC
jgi:protein phosphatase